MAYLSWMNLIMINVWKSSVLRKWKLTEKIWYRCNQLYGWLSPILWVLIGFAISYIFNIDTALDWNNESSIVGKFCYRTSLFMLFEIINFLVFLFSDLFWLFFYLPVSIVVMINLILFLWSIWGLYKNGNDISVDRKTSIFYK